MDHASRPWAGQIPHRVVLARLPVGWPPQRLAVPGSKSHSNRALLLAAWAHGRSRLRGWLHAEDTDACLTAVRRLGADARLVADGIDVDGHGGRPAAVAAPIELADSGTLARFLPGLLAAAPAAGGWLLCGSPQLCGRPMKPLLAALAALGGGVAPAGADGALPWRLAGGGLEGGEVEVASEASSQFLSGLMMAAPLCRRPLTVTARPRAAQPAYLAMTAAAMRSFGVVLEAVGPQSWAAQPAAYRGSDLCLEADASTAAYFFALAAASGGTVTVTNMPAAGLQPDLAVLEVLARMGCRVSRRGPEVTVAGPPRLAGGWAWDVGAMADQLPTLAALAALADGPVRLVGAAHVRHHESDRIAAMADTLAAVGAEVDVHPDGLAIRGPARLRPARLSAHGDHRVIMAWAPVAAAVGGLALEGCGAVAKTCPGFFTLLAGLGAVAEKNIGRRT